MTVLLVEDDDGIARFYERALTNAGIETYWLTHGSQALHFMRRLTPDLIILDLVLPDMNGLEVLDQIRAGGYSGPVIAVSGDMRLEPEEKARFAACLDKPIRLNYLVETVRAALGLPTDTRGGVDERG